MQTNMANVKMDSLTIIYIIIWADKIQKNAMTIWTVFDCWRLMKSKKFALLLCQHSIFDLP